MFHYCSDIRRAGAAALDLCWLASGTLDGFWEKGLSAWDMAAGSLIISEAGGIVTDFQGEAHYLESGNILAANPRLHKFMLELIAE
jgi:myo-inositol-1(or 4)-monophosphatase